MLNLFKLRFLPYTNWTIARVTVIAVNIEQIIPIISVTAKPLIGPVPIANRINATKNVVKFESRMVL